MRAMPSVLAVALFGCPAPDGNETGDTATDLDADGYGTSVDCDDADPDVHPAALEQCDHHDDDCDGRIDEHVKPEWYADRDGDGFGDPELGVSECEAPRGFVATPRDCDDADPHVNPGEDERCDAQGVDEDCNGLVDDEDPGVDLATLRGWAVDADGDGYAPNESVIVAWTCDGEPGYAARYGDCASDDPTAHPGGIERWDGVDDDCDGVVDEAGPHGGVYGARIAWHYGGPRDPKACEGSALLLVDASSFPAVRGGGRCGTLSASIVDVDHVEGQLTTTGATLPFSGTFRGPYLYGDLGVRGSLRAVVLGPEADANAHWNGHYEGDLGWLRDMGMEGTSCGDVFAVDVDTREEPAIVGDGPCGHVEASFTGFGEFAGSFRHLGRPIGLGMPISGTIDDVRLQGSGTEDAGAGWRDSVGFWAVRADP